MLFWSCTGARTVPYWTCTAIHTAATWQCLGTARLLDDAVVVSYKVNGSFKARVTSTRLPRTRDATLKSRDHISVRARTWSKVVLIFTKTSAACSRTRNIAPSSPPSALPWIYAGGPTLERVCVMSAREGRPNRARRHRAGSAHDQMIQLPRIKERRVRPFSSGSELCETDSGQIFAPPTSGFGPRPLDRSPTTPPPTGRLVWPPSVAAY